MEKGCINQSLSPNHILEVRRALRAAQDLTAGEVDVKQFAFFTRAWSVRDVSARHMFSSGQRVKIAYAVG